MTCELGITFADEWKDFYPEKSCQSSCRRAKRSRRARVAGKKRFFLVLQLLEGLEEHHRIQDLNEIQYGIRENAIFLDWIRDVTATREAGFAKILAQVVVLGKETGDGRSSGCELVVWKERDCGIRTPLHPSPASRPCSIPQETKGLQSDDSWPTSLFSWILFSNVNSSISVVVLQKVYKTSNRRFTNCFRWFTIQSFSPSRYEKIQ